MTGLISAETVNETISANIDVPANRFWVRDYNGDDVQVRLDPDGKVYLSYTTNNRRIIQSCELSWSDFLTRFRPFVDVLVASEK